MRAGPHNTCHANSCSGTLSQTNVLANQTMRLVAQRSVNLHTYADITSFRNYRAEFEKSPEQLEDRGECRQRTPSRPRLDDTRREWVARSLSEGAVPAKLSESQMGDTSRKHPE